MQTNPIDAVFPIVAAAVENWITQIDAEQIKAKVTKTLDAQGESLVLKLLGFSAKWGGWEVDHCNGRNGESAAGDYFKSLHQQAIQEWMADNFKVTMTPAMMKSIQKQVQSDYVFAVKRGLEDAVQEQADKDVAALIADITKSTQADNYLKLRELLSPTKKAKA